MVTVNTSGGGPNVILKKGLCGSRAAFAKVTRSKWLLGVLWAAAGLGVRASGFAGAWAGVRACVRACGRYLTTAGDHFGGVRGYRIKG